MGKAVNDRTKTKPILASIRSTPQGRKMTEDKRMIEMLYDMIRAHKDKQYPG